MRAISSSRSLKSFFRCLDSRYVVVASTASTLADTLFAVEHTFTRRLDDDHRTGKFEELSIVDTSLRHLPVDPSIVPFSFSSGISQLDEQNIMIDPAGVIQGPPGDITSLLVCPSCQRSLENGVRPSESLANYR